MGTTIDELVEDCRAVAVDKGWLPNDLRPLEVHALIATEIAEASETIRNRDPEIREAEELGDVVLRIMTYFAQREWDLEEVLSQKIAYNKTRPYRHGKYC